MDDQRGVYLCELISFSQLLLEDVRDYLVKDNEHDADQTAQQYEEVLEKILFFTPSSLDEFHEKLQFVLEYLLADSDCHSKFSTYKSRLLSDLSKLRERYSD